MNLPFYRKLVILNGAVPALVLAWDAYREQLGANAVNNALHITGIVSLVFLFLSLAITPVRALTGWNSLVAFRRALGLYGFAYALIHLGIYVALDRMGDLQSTFEEITTRRFLLVGFIAVLLMLPLAVTSTNSMIRRLGPARWKLLHRLAYAVAILGVVHYYMLVKSDVRQPLAFAAVLTPILGFRPIKHYVGLRRSAKTAASPPSRPSFFNGELAVAEIRDETHDVKTVRLVDPTGGDIPFVHRPGQYMNLELPIDGDVVRRSYTIASSPSQRGHVELTIKRDPNGRASRFVHDQLTVGDRIRIGAPAGRFFFDGSGASSVLLVSGGVGITPLMSILRYLTDHAWSGTIHFVHALRTADDMIYAGELREIARRFDSVRVIHWFSRSMPDVPEGLPGDRWVHLSGHVDGEELRSRIPELRTLPVFLCGPDPMMGAVRRTLLAAGVPEAHISTEEFVSPSSPAHGGAAPNGGEEDTRRSTVTAATITFTRSSAGAEVGGEQTVLEAAEAAGVALPWECRSGICGQCKVRCTAGRTRMEFDDAISPAELAEGWILACQARALDTSLEIDA